MKVTKARRKWIEDRVRRFCAFFGTAEVPRVVLTRKEVLEMPVELTKGRRTSTHRYLGVCYKKAKTLFINLRKFRSLREAENTIAHECVHWARKYSHGRQFDKAINRALHAIAKIKLGQNPSEKTQESQIFTRPITPNRSVAVPQVITVTENNA